jgi:dihydroorotate dehydrogenase
VQPTEVILDTVDDIQLALHPTYRIDKSFEWNAEHGPTFARPYPNIPETPLKDFFGLKVKSRFGLAASLGMTAEWIGLYARLGFDILTYKTVRAQVRRAHAPPNWIFLDETCLALDQIEHPCHTVTGVPAAPSLATAAGSIGTPSSDPSFWQRDIPRARERLGPGQVLIVSVMATADDTTTEDILVAEFEELAAMVRAAGAQIVEANLSCPNVREREAEAYRDAALAGRVAAALRRGAGDLPVLLKTGPIEDDAAMSAFLHAVAPAADGVVMINAPRRLVQTEKGAPAFGPGREHAGIMGRGIHPIAIDCVRRAVATIDRDRLGLKVIAVGGAVSVTEVQAFLRAGAYAALAASFAAWNPYLAAEIKQADPSV